MALTLYTTPAANNWSRNQIRFKVGTDTPLATVGLYIQCTIQFAFTGQPLTDALVFPLVPDARGLIDVDVSRVVDRLLLPYLPAPDAGIVLAATQSGRIGVSFTEYSISAPSGGTVLDAGEYSIYWGGQSYQSWRGSAWFDNVYPGKKILSWHSSNRTVTDWQPLYLSYLHLAADASDVTIKVQVHFTDGTDEAMAPVAFPDAGTAKEQRLYHIAAGYGQLGIADVNPDKLVHYYTVGVYADTSLISELITCTIDFTPDYRRIAFVYFNSLGGLDSICLKGEQNESFTRDFDLVDLNTSRSNQRAALLPGQSAMNGMQEQQQYKGNIGFTDEPQLQDLRRELFLSKGIFELKPNRWWPVNVLDKTVETGELQAQLKELPIEWSYAFANDSYTPAWQDIGEENTAGIACPVITHWTADSNLFVSWVHTANHLFDRYRLRLLNASSEPVGDDIVFDIPFGSVLEHLFESLTADAAYSYQLYLEASDGSTSKLCTYDAVTIDDSEPAPSLGLLSIEVINSTVATAAISNVNFALQDAVLDSPATFPVVLADGLITGTIRHQTAKLVVNYAGMDENTIRITANTVSEGVSINDFVVSGDGVVMLAGVISSTTVPTKIEVL